ncbi:inositol monophosphatase family protein [Actinopolyspora halophila]|uniref:inositol monophosphatase family protein n=1 Tax=Actinopolyspora halophila TaxID=1850 RepID=UPI000360ACEA|nr:inositol monophosphatase family protein [Actinopolyspora halophila]
MSTPDLDLAHLLSDRADAITNARFRSTDLRINSKPDRTPVTDADLAVEDTVRAELAEHRPEDLVVGEERGGDLTEGRFWILDPIDGTKNFLRGLPVWATLTALVEDGSPVVGVVSAPALHRRWWASAGGGAYRRIGAEGAAERINVSEVTELADSYLSTTHLGSWTERELRAEYLRLVDACWESRAFGDFWQHCLVAEGAIDLAAEPLANEWDLAAVQILVEEAGGNLTDLSGRRCFDGGEALTSNGAVHRKALELLGG